MSSPRGRVRAKRGSVHTGRGSAVAALVAASLGGILVLGCGDAGSSTGGSSAPGNTVVNDTRDAAPRPPANPDPGDGSIPTGQPDASYTVDGGAASGSGGYPGIAECSSCACPAATAYCFGGATPRKTPMIVSPESPAEGGASDGGSTPCPMVAAGSVGCTALPAGATDCVSLIAGLQATYACYLVCAFDGKQMTAYCPSP